MPSPSATVPPQPPAVHRIGPALERAAPPGDAEVTRQGAEITFFRLGDDPGLVRFVQAMAQRAGGRVVAPDPEDLGAAVVGEFLRNRYADPVWDMDWD